MNEDDEEQIENEETNDNTTRIKKSRLMHKLIWCIVIVAVLVGVSTVYLSPTDGLQKADAIVAISGGDTNARTMKAVELYHAGWAPMIIFSGAAADPESPSNAEVMKQIALGNGVPLKAILTDKQAKNTAQNASGSLGVLNDKGYKIIILVTSQYHQRRAFLQFTKKFGSSVRIINQPAKDFYWSRWTWWTSLQGWFLTISELVKIPVVMVRGY